MAQEIEYKFSITEAQVNALKTHAIIQQEVQRGPSIEFIENIYFDTPDFALLKNRYVLRIRKVKGRYFQTVKYGAPAKRGLSKRQEWEYEIPSAQFNLSLLPKDIQKKMPLESQLKPCLMMNFERIVYVLHRIGIFEIELAIDRGDIIVQQKHLPIFEMELELKKGNEKNLHIIAKELQRDLHLVPLDLGKAERGYQLLKKR